MALSLIDSGITTGNNTSYNTNSVAFVTGRLYVVGIQFTNGGGADGTDLSLMQQVGGFNVMTSNALPTLSEIAFNTIASTTTCILVRYIIATSTTTATISVQFGSGMTSLGWFVLEETLPDVSSLPGSLFPQTPKVSALNSTSSRTYTPDALADATNAIVAFSGHNQNSTADTVSGTGWTQPDAGQAINNPNNGFEVAINEGGSAQAVTFSGAGTGARAIIGFEVGRAVAGDPPDGDPTLLTATATTVSKVTLAWTENATNADNVKIEQAPDVAGSPGSFVLIDTIASGTETYEVTGLTPGTKYHWQVKESNGDGDSDPSNTDDATTFSNPTISRVDPASASVALPVRGLSVDLSFEVDAAAVSGSITSIVWESDVDGVLDSGTNETLVIDIDTDLPTDGANILTVTVTNSEEGTAQTGWNLNITEPGVSVAPSREPPLVEIPILYATQVTLRSLRFRDPVTKSFVVPTFAAGDVTIRQDDGTRENCDNFPIRVGSTFDFDFTIEVAEATCAQAKIIIDDQSDPKTWLPEVVDLYTYGHASAFFPEEQIQTDGSGNALARTVGYRTTDADIDLSGDPENDSPVNYEPA